MATAVAIGCCGRYAESRLRVDTTNDARRCHGHRPCSFAVSLISRPLRGFMVGFFLFLVLLLVCIPLLSAPKMLSDTQSVGFGRCAHTCNARGSGVQSELTRVVVYSAGDHCPVRPACAEQPWPFFGGILWVHGFTVSRVALGSVWFFSNTLWSVPLGMVSVACL